MDSERTPASSRRIGRLLRIPRGRGLLLVLAISILAGASSFLAAERLLPQSEAAAQTNEGRGPWRWVPLKDEEAAEPRTPRTINGITVSPDALSWGRACEPDLLNDGTAEDIADTVLDIQLGYLPPGTKLEEGPIVLNCGSRPLSVGYVFYVPTDRDLGRFGGGLTVIRFEGERSFRLDRSSARLRGTTVGDRDAILAPPLTTDGFGSSAILIHEPYGLTVIRADGITEGELRRIAESITDRGEAQP